MAIIDGQLVEVNWNQANKKRYIELGYDFTKIGESFLVDVKHVSHQSMWMVFATCDNCGSKFQREMKMLTRGKHHYCCHGCSAEHHSELAKENAIYNTCEECDEQYKTVESMIGITRFCSAKCLGSWQSRAFKGENNPRYVERIEIPCAWCGNKLYKTKSYLEGRENVFCNRNCSDKYHGQVYMKREDVIERNRAVMLNNLSSGKIKSTATSPHNTVVDILKDLDINFEEEYNYRDKLSFDIHLPDYNLFIEVNGGFWHCDHRTYDYIQYDYQLNRIISDKRKRTTLKSQEGKQILYLWEKDIDKNPDTCAHLISLFISNDGELENYQSFNYFTHDDKLYLNSEIEIPYMDWDYADLAKIVDTEVRERKTTYRADNYVEYNCDYCGKDNKQLKSQFNKNKRHFCSTECYHNYGRIEYECDNCGVEMKIPKYRFVALQGGNQKSICCSRKCGDEYFSKNYSGEKSPQYSQVTKKCKFCNKEFSIAKGRKDESKYCSPECSQKSQRKRIELPCDECGSTISKNPSQLKKTKNYFCSHKCADNFRSKSKRENRNCIICGESFNVRKTSKVKMCSIKCQGVWQSQNLRGENANNYKNGEHVKELMTT